MSLLFGIGIDNFGELIRRGAHFVDKTAFIHALFDRSMTLVTLLTRPRRFGKTLNLSMLQHFLAKSIGNLPTRELFRGLAIEKSPLFEKHQGKYPVIFLTLKGIKATNFQQALADCAGILRRLYQEHEYLLQGALLTSDDQERFRRMLQQTASQSEMQTALLDLCRLLYQHYGVKPWLLIDEYDTPLHSAYLEGYYEEMVPFMQSFLGSALKGNDFLERAVLTGILRIAKESLFSDLNNLMVCTLFDTEYSDAFGFTETEVHDLLVQAQLTEKMADIQRWYNGYLCGNTVLYNPWSIIQCLSKAGALQPYWVMTGGTRLVQDLLAQADHESKKALEQFMQGKTIMARISDHLVFQHLGAGLESLLSLLLAAGYLKAVSRTLLEDENLWLCELSAPNQEVRATFRNSVLSWFSSQGAQSQFEYTLSALVEGEPEGFADCLQLLLTRIVSYFDASGQEPEKFYHGFVLGMMVHLSKTHSVESNRESGFGRYDVMIMPNDHSKPGIVLEFKVAYGSKTLETTAQEALQQIKDRQYAENLHARGVTRVLLLGLAFRGKEVRVVWDSN